MLVRTAFVWFSLLCSFSFSLFARHYPKLHCKSTNITPQPQFYQMNVLTLVPLLMLPTWFNVLFSNIYVYIYLTLLIRDAALSLLCIQ